MSRKYAYVRFANNGVTTSAFTVERSVTINSVARWQERRFPDHRPERRGVESRRAAQRRTRRFRAAKSGVRRAAGTAEIRRLRQLGRSNGACSIAADGSARQIDHRRGAVAKKLIAAGYFERSAEVSAFGNKRGNFGYERSTDARLTTTIRNAAGHQFRMGWTAFRAHRRHQRRGPRGAARWTSVLGGRSRSDLTRASTP